MGDSLDAVFAAMSDETEGRRLDGRDDAILRQTLQTLPPGRTWYLVSVVDNGDGGPDALARAVIGVKHVAEAVIDVCPALAGWRILVRGSALLPGQDGETPSVSPVSVSPVAISPVARAVTAAALVLRTELECDVRVVDYLAIPAGKDRLLMELVRGTEEIVAVRGGERFAPHFRELPQTWRAQVTALSSCCVITDGLGAHALALARQLVAAGHRRLALVARRGPAIEAEREDPGVTIGALDANLRAIDELRASGAFVRVFAADLTDAGALARLWDRITELMGPIGLVLHTADAPPMESLVGATRDDASLRTLVPRSAVAALASLTAMKESRAPLVLFSSLSAFRGIAGQFDHAAVNGYLDGLAQAAAARETARDRGRPVLALASHAVTSPDAVRLMLRLVSLGRSGAVAISPVPPDVRMATHDAPSQPRHRALHTAPVAPRSRREARLAELWRDALRIDTVGVEDDFFELGGTSLLLTRLVARARKQLGVALPLADLLGAPTVINWLRDPDIPEPRWARPDRATRARSSRELQVAPDCAV